MWPKTKKSPSTRGIMPVIPVAVAAQPPTAGVPDYDLSRQEAAQQAARDAKTVVRAEGLLANPGPLPFVARMNALVPAWQHRWHEQGAADLAAGEGAMAALVAGTHPDSAEYGGGLDLLELDVERAALASLKASKTETRILKKMKIENVEPADARVRVGGPTGLNARRIWPILALWFADFALIMTAVYVATGAPNPIEPAVIGGIVATVLTVGAEHAAAGYREHRIHGGKFPLIEVIMVGLVLSTACVVLPYVRSIATVLESGPTEQTDTTVLPGESVDPGTTATDPSIATGVPMWALYALFLIVMMGIFVAAFLHGYRSPLRLQRDLVNAQHKRAVALESEIEARARLAALATMVQNYAESLLKTVRIIEQRIQSVPDHANAIVGVYHYELGQWLASPMAWDAMRLVETPSVEVPIKPPSIETPDLDAVKKRATVALKSARADHQPEGPSKTSETSPALLQDRPEADIWSTEDLVAPSEVTEPAPVEVATR